MICESVGTFFDLRVPRLPGKIWSRTGNHHHAEPCSEYFVLQVEIIRSQKIGADTFIHYIRNGII